MVETTDVIKENLIPEFVVDIIPPEKARDVYDQIRSQIPEFQEPDYPHVPFEKFDPYEHSGGVLWGVYVNNEIAGYGTAFAFDPPAEKETLTQLQDHLHTNNILWADEIAVLPKYRSVGATTRLDDALIRYGEKAGYDYICLRTWNLREGVLGHKSKTGWFIAGMEDREDLAHTRVDVALPTDAVPVKVTKDQLSQAEEQLAESLADQGAVTIKNTEFAKRTILHKHGYHLYAIDYAPDIADYTLHFKKL